MARTLSADAMSTAWATGVGGAGTKWTNGISNPRQAPNANPAQNTANWQTGVADAAPTYEAAISSSNYVPAWQAGAKAKVASYTGSGSARKANYAAAAAKLVPLINQALTTLPPKGPKGTNTARSTAFQTAMHAVKGQARVKA